MSALIFSVLLTIAVCLACAGWGELCRRALRLTCPLNERFLTDAWLGWSVLLAALLGIHFLHAIDGKVSVALLGLGAVFAVGLLPWKEWWRFFTRLSKAFRWMLAVTVVAWLCWICYRALGAPDYYDMGLYYLNMIRWNNEFPLVPGLANLHGRFGFNNTNLLYAAWLNFFPWFGHGHNLAFGVCLLLAVIEGSVALLRIGCPAGRGATCVDTFGSALLLPLSVLLACIFPLSVPAADFFNIILLPVVFVRVCRIWRRGQAALRQNADVAVLAALAASAISIKLSQIVVMPLMFLVAGWYLLRASRMRLQLVWQPILRASPIPLVLLVLWLFRGGFLSGLPLYPSRLLTVKVDWQVPEWLTRGEMNWVRSWARKPFAPPEQVLHDWSWIHTWIHTLTSNPVYWALILLPLAIAVCALVMALLSRHSPCGYPTSQRNGLGLLVLPLIAAICFWFYMAPAASFAGALFWCLAVAMWVRLLDGRRLPVSRRVAFGMLMALLLLPTFGGVLKLAPTIFGSCHNGYAPIPIVQLKREQLSQGVFVWTPVVGDSCWDSPLPSCPAVNKGLSLRNKDVRNGFCIRQPVKPSRTAAP